MMEGALAAGTPLILADGTPLPFDQLVAQIEGFDLGATAAPAAGAPAAGAAVAGSTAGYGINTTFDGSAEYGGRPFVAVLGDTTLNFTLAWGPRRAAARRGAGDRV